MFKGRIAVSHAASWVLFVLCVGAFVQTGCSNGEASQIPEGPLPDGSPCNENSDCQSDYCDGNMCCEAGGCCNTAGDCPETHYSEHSICFDSSGTTDCQGSRTDALCNSHMCESIVVDDDSGCIGVLHVCPDHLVPIACLDLEEQTEPECPNRCWDDDDCDHGYVCDVDTCVEPTTPVGPAQLLDFEAIDNMTLDDLGWQMTARDTVTLSDGSYEVTRIKGDFSGGLFATLCGPMTDKPEYSTDLCGEDPSVDVEVEIEIHEKATIYFPQDYPDVPESHAGFGIIMGSGDDDPEVEGLDDLLLMIKAIKMPVLFHDPVITDWRQIGYGNRNSFTVAMFRALLYKNRCNTQDLSFGNYVLKIAEVDMRAITLLKRLANRGGGFVDEVALYGGSKEGIGCWLASGADSRIKVASCAGYHLEDLQATHAYETDWGCRGIALGGTDTSHLVVFRHWLNETPAGNDTLTLMSVPRYEHVLRPEFFLIWGGVGKYDTHDGKNYPIGCESPFLSSFTSPWRYVRERYTRKYLIFHVGKRLLRQPSNPENWPKVVSTTAETDGTAFLVRAEVDFAPDTVRLWWNHSPNRAYNTEGHPEWQSVDMHQTGNSYVSPLITEIPRGHEAAWYVEAEKEITVGGHVLYRRDASPVQFVFRNPPETCTGLVVPDWCE